MIIKNKSLRKQLCVLSACACIISSNTLHIMANKIAIEQGENQSLSALEAAGMFLAIDEQGNSKYIKVKDNDMQEELQLPERTHKNTTFKVVRVLDANNVETIASYTSFAQANSMMKAQAKGRSKGTFAVYTNNQIRAITNGVVNFKTKACSVNTTYEGIGSSPNGYVNGCYGADAAYLGVNADGSKVKFKMSGVVGWVNKAEVQILNYDDDNAVRSVNHYKVVNGRIQHRITLNIAASTYPSVIDIGPKQEYMNEGDILYSYDAHYFYRTYASMIKDYTSDVYTNAINAKQPYYNYFQFLSQRTKTNFTANNFNTLITNSVGSKTSALSNQGSNFMNAQNIYGANAAIVLGLSINESGWGLSEFALTRNNIFGHAAFDSNPNNATYYPSVAESIAQHAREYVSKNYLDPNDGGGRYYGSHLGDKSSGMNVKYAAAPYWGETAASFVYQLEKLTNNQHIDQDFYTLAIKQEDTMINIRKDPSINSTILYKSSKNNHYPLIILGSVEGDAINGNNKWYKVQSDPPLANDRSYALQSGTHAGFNGEYNYDVSYGYVSAEYVNIVNRGQQNPDDKPSQNRIGDVNGDQKVTSIDYILVRNHILNISLLNGTSLVAGDVNKDGKVSSIDYILIRNDILGISKLQ